MIDHQGACFDLVTKTTVHAKKIFWNLTPALLYEKVIQRSEAMMTDSGSLVVYTGKYTGRSPNDKFFVNEPASYDHVSWGKTNRPIETDTFERLKSRILGYLSDREIFIQDCYGGADPSYRFPARIITDTAWQSLFSYNMFLHASDGPPNEFTPEFTVLAATGFETEPQVDGTRSDVVIAIHLGQKLALIAGTRYAGEIKKTVFTVQNYLFPLQGILPMHCAANIGTDNKSALFFGLSGTGKTTLSADPKRRLIGDDEHGWGDHGVFNFEGGCYAKVIHLSAEDEPEIFKMTHRFGTLLENVVMDPVSREVNLDDDTITENTRASYRLDQLGNYQSTGMGDHPENVVFLAADAFGILPPIARLTPEQAMYHFLSGYTAKVAGTEKGVKEPQATFSTCFGSPFMVHNPMVYARLLGEKIRKQDSQCWLINTGWTGGAYGVGQRMKIAYTRAMVDSLLNRRLDNVEYVPDPIFGFLVPVSCSGIQEEVLNPRNTWTDPIAYDEQACKLAGLFLKNFEQFSKFVPPEVLSAGPRIV